jgi:hypothetical protein
MRRIAICSLVALGVALGVALAGCITGMGYSTVDQVTNAAREYNNDVRWGRYEQAATHVPRDKRARFVEKRSQLDDELEIADFELVNIVIDKQKETASARVDYTWMLKERGIVEKTTTKQNWERRDGVWVVAQEVRVKGTPLSLFDEPPRPPATETTATDKSPGPTAAAVNAADHPRE